MSVTRTLSTSDAKTLLVDELSVGFGGVVALDHVSMSAAQGEIVGVIGPNGAGKTTLFNVICGFVRANSGVITYDGTSLLEHHHPHDLTKLGIARTLQGVGLFAGLSVLENVMVGAQSATALRHRVGVPGSVALEPGRTRVAARPGTSSRSSAWRLRPALPRHAALFHSEADGTGPCPHGANPVSSCSTSRPVGCRTTRWTSSARMIRGLSSRMGVLLVEHHMDLVMSVCDRLVVLNFGQVIADGTPESVRSNPEVATAYLGDEVAEAAADPAGMSDHA